MRERERERERQREREREVNCVMIWVNNNTVNGNYMTTSKVNRCRGKPILFCWEMSSDDFLSTQLTQLHCLSLVDKSGCEFVCNLSLESRENVRT